MDNQNARICFTYRSGFPEIMKSGWKTDYGWGCTIRSGQMMMANYLLKTNAIPPLSIPELFHDTLNSPFSIHNICKIGLDFKKTPGHWYSSETMGRILEKLDDRVVFGMHSESRKTFDFLWLVPLRLGLHSIAEEYKQTITELMKLDQTVGACGGKNNSAYFFVQVIENEWVYLDPHNTRLTSTKPMDYITTDFYSFDIKKVNSSLLVGFSIQSEDDYNKVKNILDRFDFLKHSSDTEKSTTTRVEDDYLVIE